MKVKLVAEGNKGIVEVALTKNELAALFDLQFMLEKETWRTLKLNKIDKEILSAFRKFEHIYNDVLCEGKVYGCKAGGKFVLLKERQYMVKKPRWRRLRAHRRR